VSTWNVLWENCEKHWKKKTVRMKKSPKELNPYIPVKI